MLRLIRGTQRHSQLRKACLCSSFESHTSVFDFDKVSALRPEIRRASIWLSSNSDLTSLDLIHAHLNWSGLMWPTQKTALCGMGTGLLQNVPFFSELWNRILGLDYIEITRSPLRTRTPTPDSLSFQLMNSGLRMCSRNTKDCGFKT